MKIAVGLVAVLAAAGAFGGEVVAQWTFGKDGLRDVSGNGHDLVSFGAKLEDEGARLDGKAAYLRTEKVLDLSDCRALTVECWFKPEGIVDPFAVIFGNDLPDEPGTSGGFVTYLSTWAKGGENSVRGQFRTLPGSWQIERQLGAAALVGGWHHLAYVIDPSAAGDAIAVLYLDGQAVPDTHYSQGCVAKAFLNQKFFIGGGALYARSRGNHFQGVIGGVRITAKALKPEEFFHK